MGEYALVLNAGSSSLKFRVFESAAREGWRVAARGQIEGIGSSPRFSARDGAGEHVADHDVDVRDARHAVDLLGQWLRSKYGGSRVVGVGHRVVHGGASFAGPTVINAQVLLELRALSPLAPLHQPHNIAAIEAVAERIPGVPQVACFDTSFHRGRSAVAELVPLPKDVRESGVQRYGFHGLSYEYVASVLPAVAPQIARGRVIVCHLGSGASMCALRAGRSIDSTMAFTALDGLPMGTRSGQIDPGVLLYLLDQGMSVREVEALLYRQSGLLGLSEVSNDMRELLASGKPRAAFAIDHFVYAISKHLGALAGALGGLDGLVFTAGIGERSPDIRARVCRAAAWLGVDLDEAANAEHGPRISRPGSRVSAWVIPTNEELMIARHTVATLGAVSGAPRRRPASAKGIR